MEKSGWDARRRQEAAHTHRGPANNPHLTNTARLRPAVTRRPTMTRPPTNDTAPTYTYTWRDLRLLAHGGGGAAPWTADDERRARTRLQDELHPGSDVTRIYVQRGLAPDVDAVLEWSEAPKSVLLAIVAGVHTFRDDPAAIVTDYAGWLVRKAGMDLARTLDGRDGDDDDEDDEDASDYSDMCASPRPASAGTTLAGTIAIIRRMW